MKISSKYNHLQLLAFAVLSIALTALALGHPWANYLVIGEGYFFSSILEYKFLLVSSVLAIGFFVLSFFARNDHFKVKLDNTKSTFIVFFIFALLSFFWSYDTALFQRKIFLYVTGIALFLLAGIFSKNKLLLHYFSILSTILLLCVSAIGLMQYFLDFPSRNLLAQVVRPSSTFANKNMATHFLVLLLPMAFYLFFSSRSFFKIFLSFLVIAITLSYVYITLTKSAWVAILAQFFVFLIYSFFKNNRKNIALSKNHVLTILITGFLILSSSLFLVDPKNEDSSNVDKFVTQMDGSIKGDQSRLGIYSTTLDMIYKAPFFGHGLGSWSSVSIDIGHQHLLQKAHNDLLELTTELGLTGFALFVIFAYFIIRDWLIIKKESSNSLFYDMSILALVGIFTQMQFTFPFQLITGFVVSGIFIGFISAKAVTYKHSLYEISLSKKINYLYILFFSITLLIISLYLKIWNSAINDSMLSSGTHFTKFDKNKLLNLPNYPFQDQEFFSYYNEYIKNNYEMRGHELLEITIARNPRNIYAQRKAFEITLKERNFNLAKKYISAMIKHHEFHGITLISQLEFGKYTKNFKYSLDAYTKHKERLLSTASYKRQYNVIKYLLQWSITLQKYEDTEFLYEALMNFSDGKTKDDIEYSMAKFYAYTSNSIKGYKHYKYVLEENNELIEESIKNFYENKLPK